MRKQFQHLVIFCLLSLVVSAADEAKWSTDFAQALQLARKENRLVLVFFTGSDWCVWCQRVREEVLMQTPFMAYANEALVLVELDYPRKKELSPELKKQNEELAERFGVTSYPTILFLDAKGSELGRLGYMQGGAKTFVRELKRLADKHTLVPSAN